MKDNKRKNKSSKPRNRKYYSKKDDINKSINGPAGNDPAFYSKYPELLLAASRIPFPFVPGSVIDPGDLYANNASGVGQSWSNTIQYPGIMSLEYCPSVGYSNDNTSPASVTAREMYAKIRSHFSGALDVDGPDLFMYTIALQQIHAYIAMLKRIYRTIDFRTGYNRLTPRTLLQAMGVQEEYHEDIIQKKDVLWGNINTLIHSVNAFAVPNDMPLFDRMERLNTHVYRDEANVRSQLYVFKPLGFWKLDGVTESTGTSLQVMDWVSSDKSVSGLYNFGLEMISALNGSDDAWTIDGYLRKAYGEGGFRTTALLLNDEILDPVYDETILMQIENSTPVGAYGGTTVHPVTQDPTTNAIIHQPKTRYQFDAPLLINIHSPTTPNPVDVVEATRLKVRLARIEDSNEAFIHCSDVYITNVSMLVFFPDTGVVQTLAYDYVVKYNVTDTTLTTFGNVFDVVLRRSSFHAAPNLWVLAITDTGAHASWFVCDVSQLSVVNGDTLDELTRVCLYSEFNAFTRV